MAPSKQTSFEKTIPDYRKRIVVALSKALFIPPLITTLVLWRTNSADLPLSRHFIAFLSIPITITIRSRYSVWIQDREAKRLNARIIPRVQGKLPGNLDVVRRIMKSFKEDYILQGFADLMREHNTTILNTRFFWDDQIISMEEGVMQFVFSTGFTHFEKGVLWHERIDKLLGTGLFNADGAVWKKGRAMARPFFSRDRISDVDIFERTSNTTLDLILSRSSVNQPIDIQDLLHRFTLDTASEFLFGTRLDTLSRPLTEPGKVKLGPKGSIPIHRTNEFDAFTEAFERVAVLVTRRGAQGTTWPLMELFEDKTEEPIRIIMDWLEPLVKQAIERRESMKGLQGSDIQDEVFLDFLASQTDDVEHIRYELVTYLIASRDTTATLLTFAMYFFAMHPDVCERLRNEILDTFGPNQPPTYEKLKGLKYLRAVFNETLRLFPSAPLVTRRSGDVSLTIPTAGGPLYFPCRTQVVNISLLLHRRHDLWGDDADEFRPDRWFDPKTLEKVNSTPFMYCPFSGGPRSCIGQEFAFNESAYFLVKLLQRFSTFSLATEYQPEGSLPNPAWKGRSGRQSIEKIAPATSMTVFSKGGLWVFADFA